MAKLRKIVAGAAVVWDGVMLLFSVYAAFVGGFTTGSAMFAALAVAFSMLVFGFLRAMLAKKVTAGIALILLGTLTLLSLTIPVLLWDVRIIVSLSLSLGYLVVYFW